MTTNIPSFGARSGLSTRILLLDVMGVARAASSSKVDDEPALGFIEDLRGVLTGVGGSIVATSRLAASSDRDATPSAPVGLAVDALLGEFAEPGLVDDLSLADRVDEARRTGGREVGAVLRRWILDRPWVSSLAIVDRSSDLGSMNPHAIWIGGSAGRIGAREVNLLSSLLSMSIEQVRGMDDRLLDRIEEEAADLVGSTPSASASSSPGSGSSGSASPGSALGSSDLGSDRSDRSDRLALDRAVESRRCLRWAPLLIDALRGERSDARAQLDRIAVLEAERVQMRRDLDSAAFSLGQVPRLMRELRALRAEHEVQRARLQELGEAPRAHRAARVSQISMAAMGTRRGRGS